MTPEAAQAIVDRVASRHPKFKVYEVTANSSGGKVTFKKCPVDPRRISIWFDEVGCSVIQTGYDLIHSEWFTYFRETEVS